MEIKKVIRTAEIGFLMGASAIPNYFGQPRKIEPDTLTEQPGSDYVSIDARQTIIVSGGMTTTTTSAPSYNG